MTPQAGRIRGWSGAAIPIARPRRTTARRPRRSPGRSNGGDGRVSAPGPWCRRPGWLRRERSSSCGGPRSGPRRRRSERALRRPSNGTRDRRWPPWRRSLPPPLSGPGGRRLGSRSQGRWPANRGRWGCCRSCPRGPTFARPGPRGRRAFRPARRPRRPRRAIRGQSLRYRRQPRRCQVPLRHRRSRRRCPLRRPPRARPQALPVRGCLHCRLAPHRVQRAYPATARRRPAAASRCITGPVRASSRRCCSTRRWRAGRCSALTPSSTGPTSRCSSIPTATSRRCRIRGRIEPGETFYRHRMMLAAAKLWRFTPARAGRPSGALRDPRRHRRALTEPPAGHRQRYLTRTCSARTPSRQPIFLP